MYLDFEELSWRDLEDSQVEIESRSDCRLERSELEEIGWKRKMSSAYRIS